MHRSPGVRLALVVVALLLPGCGAPAGPAPRTAAEELVAATAPLTAGDFTFTASVRDERITGVVHLPSRSATLTGTTPTGATAHEIRLVGADRFDRYIPLADGSPTAWRHTEPTGGGSDLVFDQHDPDLTGAAALLTEVRSIDRVHDGDYTGTLDAAAAGGRVTVLTPAERRPWAGQLRAVRFTATVDNGGRLAALALFLPPLGGDPPHRIAVEYTGYGTSTAAPRPADTR